MAAAQAAALGPAHPAALRTQLVGLAPLLAAKVRGTTNWPRSWANVSPL